MSEALQTREGANKASKMLGKCKTIMIFNAVNFSRVKVRQLPLVMATAELILLNILIIILSSARHISFVLRPR